MAIFRIRSFRLLFGGQMASLIGDQLTYVALPFAVLQSGGSAGAIGLVLASATVPQVVFLLLGGAIADQLSRRRVMICADVVRFCSQATIAGLLLVGHAGIWQFALAQVVRGTASAFFAPAVAGLLPQLVDRERLQSANGLLTTAKALAVVLSAGVGGTVVATAGAGYALAVDAASFLVSAAMLTRLVLPPDTRRVVIRNVTSDLAAGWRAVVRRRWLLTFLAWFALQNALVMGPLQVLGPLVASRFLGGAQTWGFVIATMGLGSFAGGLFATVARPRRPLTFTALALAAFTPELVLLAAHPGTVAVAAAAFVGGASIVIANVTWNTTLQRRIPDELLSRVSAYESVSSLGFVPIGLILAGTVGSEIGVTRSLWFSAAFLVISAAVILTRVAVVEAPPGIEAAPAPTD